MQTLAFAPETALRLYEGTFTIVVRVAGSVPARFDAKLALSGVQRRDLSAATEPCLSRSSRPARGSEVSGVLLRASAAGETVRAMAAVTTGVVRRRASGTAHTRPRPPRSDGR